MKLVFILFDSLNRHLLSPYGGQINTPNFKRLSEKAQTFNKHYAGSLPCMPARRDMHTGRLSFLHRSWGPLEPFDNSFPEILFKNNIYSHLVSDHYHYWEDGGLTYHNRYDSYEFIRGQEGDAWKAMVQPPWERLREKYDSNQLSTENRNYFRNNIINREYLLTDEDYPCVQCFNHGINFLENNYKADNWLLQIETFDPHEPFTAPMRFRNNYKTNWKGGIRDWPKYGRVEELEDEYNELRSNYFALLELCDEQLGRVLDYFDQNDLWNDTGLVVTTDHGFLLGEHDFWAKNRMNMYQEIVNIPFFLYHPNQNHLKECNSLTQTIDICPTILDFFGADPPLECQGQSLLRVDADGFNHREALIYGYFGGAVNVTNGEYTYHRYPFDLMQQEIFQYTLMPTHIRQHFSVDELQHAMLNEPFDFSKGVPLLKVPVVHRSPIHKYYGPGCMIENETRLYNIVDDPKQQMIIDDPKTESMMTEYISQLMKWNHAPPEAFTRLQI